MTIIVLQQTSGWASWNESDKGAKKKLKSILRTKHESSTQIYPQAHGTVNYGNSIKRATTNDSKFVPERKMTRIRFNH